MTTRFDRPLTGYRWAQIRWGDTLQMLAARELGDAGRWHELIAFNKLAPPYIAETAAAGVLAYGGLILCPAPGPTATSTTDPDTVFERDVALTNRALEADESGDFLVVAGRANLRQALQHRVSTERGEVLYHAEYGSRIRQLIGRVAGPTASLLAAQYARSAVAADPRIARITAAKATVLGDTISVVVEAQPIVGKPIDVGATL